MEVKINLDDFDFIEKKVYESQTSDGINEVELTCGTAQASYAANKPVEECATLALHLLLRTMINNQYTLCKNCEGVEYKNGRLIKSWGI